MDWSNVTHKKHHEIMLKYAYMGRIVFIIQMVGSYITIIPLIFGNLPNISLVINEENNTDIMYRNILVGPNCWVSPFMSTTIYLLYYSLLTADIIILCAAYNGGDVYIFGIAMHLCGQFQLL
uniref:Olfactory receptor 138 n=2 Tax=Aulacocentrum confusum TaxID=2767324 RepID=A0A7G8Z9F7_9HYME|nr:olfactory receptor 138 [Aulacocentrum confusum]